MVNLHLKRMARQDFVLIVVVDDASVVIPKTNVIWENIHNLLTKSFSRLSERRYALTLLAVTGVLLAKISVGRCSIGYIVGSKIENILYHSPIQLNQLTEWWWHVIWIIWIRTWCKMKWCRWRCWIIVWWISRIIILYTSCWWWWIEKGWRRKWWLLHIELYVVSSDHRCDLNIYLHYQASWMHINYE